MMNYARHLLFALALAVPVSAQVQMNQQDNNSPSRDNNTSQSETNHAVTPLAIVAAWNDSHQFATLGAAFTSIMSWGFSGTGTSFTDAGLFAPPSGWIALGDPAVVADPSEFFYVASLTSNDGGSTIGGVAVSRSTNTSGTIALGTPVNLTPMTSGDEFDKELMAVDRSGGTNNGRVYLAISEGDFSIPPSVKVVVAHSTSTSPLTFSSWKAVSSSTGLNHGAMPAVGPSGELYVVWGQFTFTGSSLTGETVLITKSTDGGTTFSTPVTVATPTVTPSSLGSGSNTVRTRGFAYAAVDSTPSGSPTRGNVYVVFQAHPGSGSTDNSDIYFTRSTDGGTTWATPRSINTAGAVTLNPDTTTHDNWQPSIAVSPVNGHIYVSFFDRRDDPGNTKTRVYRALSTDGGLTWSNAQLSPNIFTPSTGYDSLLVSTYFGDYNWAFADLAALHFTWGDSSKTCTPPGGASNPCSPSGRGDQDVYYLKVPNLSGPDLFIQPWGFVTGIGATWQTPDIFVVNSSNVEVNASKGIVNSLRARVRNLGNTAVTGAVVHFKFSPAFAGFNVSDFKEIGTVNVNLSAAGGGSDTQIVPINWDLTNLTDNNGGLWPGPVSSFDHFCVMVTLEYPPDINLSNNMAQNNFFNVSTSTGMIPLKFLVANHLAEQADAHIEVTGLPPAFQSKVNVERLTANETAARFRLQPKEVRLASLELTKPAAFTGNKDVVANVNFVVNGKTTGGVSLLLYQAPGPRPNLAGLRAATAPFHNVREVRAEEIRPKEPIAITPVVKAQIQEPPMRTIPERVAHRQTFTANFDSTFRTLVSLQEQRKEPVALADHERGLINTKPIAVTSAQLRSMVTPQDAAKIGNFGGRYILSIFVQETGGKTSVGVDSLIFLDDLRDAPIGKRLHSNGNLEQTYLNQLATKMPK